jgi:hypothetical protein
MSQLRGLADIEAAADKHMELVQFRTLPATTAMLTAE